MANLNNVSAVETDETVLVIECDDCGEQSTLADCSYCGEGECANCRSVSDCVTEFGSVFTVHYV